MVQREKLVTTEEFETFIHLPENRERLFELIGGRIVEVVSNNLSSAVAAKLLIKVGGFVEDNNLGFLTGADGGYEIGKERYIPDIAFISKQTQAKPSRDAYNENPPDLVVEVLSPSNSATEIRIKIVNYLKEGTTIWVADPDLKRMEVYAPGESPIILTIEDTLDGGTALPGFSLPVRDIFPE